MREGVLDQADRAGWSWLDGERWRGDSWCTVYSGCPVKQGQ